LLWDSLFLLYGLALLAHLVLSRDRSARATASPYQARSGLFARERPSNRLSPKGSGAKVQVMITVGYPYPLARLDGPCQQSGAECGLVRTRRS
jgi:hypothetical protein